MTFKAGWLERQLQTASKTVGSWSTTKREALSLNRDAYSCKHETEGNNLTTEPKKK